jgi:hypothetical protein
MRKVDIAEVIGGRLVPKQKNASDLLLQSCVCSTGSSLKEN